MHNYQMCTLRTIQLKTKESISLTATIIMITGMQADMTWLLGKPIKGQRGNNTRIPCIAATAVGQPIYNTCINYSF